MLLLILTLLFQKIRMKNLLHVVSELMESNVP